MQILAILGCCSAATMLVAASDRVTVVTQSACGGNHALVMQTGPASSEVPVRIVRRAAGHVHIEVSDPSNASIIDQTDAVKPDGGTSSKAASGC